MGPDESVWFRTVRESDGMTEKPVPTKEIFIVDDDPLVRSMLTAVFSANDFKVLCFADGAALLEETRQRTPACIILDVHIPGDSGLDILKQLNAQDYPAPIFIMSGQGDIAMAVQAIRNGALDFIEKPFRGSAIVARVQEAIDAYARRPQESESNAADFHFPGIEPLSRRERDVLALLVRGASNKEAGRELGISPRTIEDHRARIMAKLGARNAADLIRIVLNKEAVRANIR
jgi:FixJ family two-component response regulator